MINITSKKILKIVGEENQKWWNGLNFKKEHVYTGTYIQWYDNEGNEISAQCAYFYISYSGIYYIKEKISCGLEIYSKTIENSITEHYIEGSIGWENFKSKGECELEAIVNFVNIIDNMITDKK